MDGHIHCNHAGGTGSSLHGGRGRGHGGRSSTAPTWATAPPDDEEEVEAEGEETGFMIGGHGMVRARPP